MSLSESEEMEYLLLMEIDERSLKFRGDNARIQTERSREWMLSGPAETGKTVAALARLDNLLATTPKAQGAMVRKVQADMSGTVLVTYKRILESSGSGAKVFGGEKPEWFDYPNEARLWIGGMDRPGKVLSGERDYIYVNQAEELTLADWETLLTRATGRGAVTDTPMVFGDCNPGPPSHWIRERERSGHLKFFESRHEDNPTLYTADGKLTPQGARTIEILETLTGVRLNRLRKGLWVAAEGVVYEDYDPVVHLIDRFEIPKDWRRFRCIDLGYTNPFVCQWWAADPDDRLYRYREIYHTGRTTRAHAAKIIELSEGETYEATICDHDAEDRATLRECDISNVPAIKDVSRGIQAVGEHLKPAGDGKPRIYYMRGALVERDPALIEARKPQCTEEEFEGYAWERSPDGKPLKEQPMKLNDHGMDATRYMVMYMEKQRATSALYAGVTEEARGSLKRVLS